MNIKLASIITLTTALLTGSTLAQGANPGANFIENWDQDGDAVVTLVEVSEKRSNVFYMFDQDENGYLSAKEYKLFDETRAADMALANEQSGNTVSHQTDQQGNQQRGAQGMSLQFNDVDGDGQVSLEEFDSNSKAWFENMDRNGDGEISTADFSHSK